MFLSMGQAITKQWKTISDDAAATMAAPAPTRHIRSRSSSFAVLRDLTQPKTRPTNGFTAQRGSRSADTIKRTYSSGDLSPVADADQLADSEFALRMDTEAVRTRNPTSRRSDYKDVQATFEDWAEHEKRRRQEELARQKAEVELVLKRTSILSLSMAGKAVEYETAAERKRREAREWTKRDMEERLQRDKRTFGAPEPNDMPQVSAHDMSWSNDFDFDEDDDEERQMELEETPAEPSWEDLEPAEISKRRRAAKAAEAARAAAEAETEKSKADASVTSGAFELEMDMTEEEFTGDFGREEIIHTVEGQDTLQGLGLRYSVPVSEIERVNLLHSNEELHIRDYIIIPTSREIAETAGKPDEQSDYERRCIALFMNEMNCKDERLAERYLRRTGFSVQESIAKFLFDQAKHRAFENKRVKEKQETGEDLGPSTGGMTFVLEGSELHLDLPDHFIEPHNDEVYFESPKEPKVPYVGAPPEEFKASIAPKRRVVR